ADQHGVQEGAQAARRHPAARRPGQCAVHPLPRRLQRRCGEYDICRRQNGVVSDDSGHSGKKGALRCGDDQKSLVTPAQAGVQENALMKGAVCWMPASAGMTIWMYLVYEKCAVRGAFFMDSPLVQSRVSRTHASTAVN